MPLPLDYSNGVRNWNFRPWVKVVFAVLLVIVLYLFVAEVLKVSVFTHHGDE